MTPCGAGPDLIHVVAAAVIDVEGRVLIAQRPPGKPLAGGWEFPGGKLEPGEERAAGLARELHEELGIEIAAPRPLMRVGHSYPHGEILIDMWVVTRYRGVPRGMDGQALRWHTQDELATAELLPADQPLVRALRLPERLTEASTAYYDIRRWTPGADAVPAKLDDRLRGAYCFDMAEAHAAGLAGADFIVLARALADADVAALCRSSPKPVFLRAATLEGCFGLGASGINDTASIC